MRSRLLPGLAAWSVLALGAVGLASAAPVVEPSPALLAGQFVLASMAGSAPPASFLARIRAGQVGGVVLYRGNFGVAGPAALVAELQAAARAGGQPPLLIATDQEGGIVKRLSGAPTLSPQRMTSAAVALAQGRATALNLTRNGIDVDLAPVLDIGRGGFITPRTFGATPADVAVRATAFAQGLGQGGVLATGKHFPGLGYAPVNTDDGASVVTASRAALLGDLLPYQRAIGAGLPIVMASTAVYPHLGAEIPAACARRIVGGLLRGQLGFQGLVITDDLNTPGVNHYFSTADAAVRAIGAGVDMVIATGSGSQAAYAALAAAIESGQLPATTVDAAYARVMALKGK